MERRKLIQSTICSLACCSIGMSFFKSVNILNGSTGSINSIAPGNKTFSMELEPEVIRLYKKYAGWLRRLTERLGYEITLKVWQDAFRDYDETKLNKILSSGWTKKMTMN
jgi:hypothetical protein